MPFCPPTFQQRTRFNVLFRWHNCVYSLKNKCWLYLPFIFDEALFHFQFSHYGRQWEPPGQFCSARCLYHSFQSDCEKKQQTQTEGTREEFTREMEWKHIRDTVLLSHPGYNFGQFGKQCNRLIKHLRTEPSLTVAFMSAGRPSSYFGLPHVDFDTRQSQLTSLLSFLKFWLGGLYFGLWSF